VGGQVPSTGNTCVDAFLAQLVTDVNAAVAAVTTAAPSVGLVEAVAAVVVLNVEAAQVLAITCLGALPAVP